MPALRPVQRLAAYVVLQDRDGATVLVRGSQRSDLPGRWSLPGGGVRHGEDPAHAAVREALEETGIEVKVSGLHDVVTDTIELPYREVCLHTVRIIYRARAAADPAGPLQLRSELDGTSDLARPVHRQEVAQLPLMPFAASALGLPAGGLEPLRPIAPQRPEPLGPTTTEAPPVPGSPAPPRVQRAGVYALVLDEGRILLSRYIGDGRWSLPGGGIHFGESPRQALLRELHEETGLPLSDPQLVDVDSVHFTGLSPSGRLEDFHAVRVVYTGRVPPDAQPQVLEVDGSADDAGWFAVDELDGLPVTHLVRNVLRQAR